MISEGLTPIKSFFRPGGELSRCHPRYEARPEQVEMAAAVWKAISQEDTLMVEAGTGVGKSLAYLYPFILWARDNGKRVAVSTETKTLQKQLMEKDIPFLRDRVGLPVKAELCLGAGNYLCRYRMQRAGQHELFESKRAARHYQKIASWSETSENGLMLDLTFIPLSQVWATVRVETDLCLRQKCPYLGSCFYFRARARQEAADLLVMNHHLFFANLSVGGAVLPPFKAVVFDEAHSLEEVATEYFGVKVSNFRVPNLLGYLYSLRSGKGFLPVHAGSERELGRWQTLIEEISRRNDDFFAALKNRWKGIKKTVRLKEAGFVRDVLSGPILNLAEQLKGLRGTFEDEESQEECKGYITRCLEVGLDIDTILNLKKEGYVYWYEEDKEGRRVGQALNMAPVQVGTFLREHLWEKLSPIILTSATLSTQGNFSFLRRRFELDSCRELILSSPYDYRNRVIIYADSRIPDPSSRLNEYEKRIIEDIEKIVRLVGGGAFILFTSYRMLNKAYEELAGAFATYGCLKQGDKDRYQLLEEFRSHPETVLFGTTSFWQGVDVPGESLRCVIIVKLPFRVPDDPLTEARIEFIEKSGGNPFQEYQLPQAIIRLRQGFGRLMRSKQDYGVVAILDPRLCTRYYGKAFFASLPPSRVTSQLTELKGFIGKMRQGREGLTKGNRREPGGGSNCASCG